MRAAKDKADDERAATAAGPPSTMPRPDNGLPEDIREHMRLMCDIIALGFQTDKTRIATLLLCRDISGLFYPFLDVRAAHHPASHDDRSEAYERVTRTTCSQLAYLAVRLDAMPEGDGTVLDNSCLLFISNMWSGSQARLQQGPGPPGRRPGRHARDRPRARLHATRATTTASSAACTSRSWTAWASSSTASATPTRVWPICEARRGETRRGEVTPASESRPSRKVCPNP